MFGFTLQDVVREFPGKNRVHLARILADMVENGMLCKIARNNYHIIPPQADAKTYVPDGHQVVKYIMQNKEYYIGYASAMKIHGLSIQSEAGTSHAETSEAGTSEAGTSEAETSEAGASEAGTSQVGTSEAGASQARGYVVTKKQIKPAVWSFRGITYQFIQQNATRFFGVDNIWINQLEKAMVSDLEKTIVDVATKPQFCGGIVELGNTLFQVKDRTDHDKLFYYLARNRNKSAKKRILFLTELLGLEWTGEHDKMMEELGSGISLLDPSKADQGRRWMKFGLKINVDPIYITNKVLPGKEPDTTSK